MKTNKDSCTLKLTFFRLRLQNENNYPIQGSTAKIYVKGSLQFLEMQPVRGFYFKPEDIFHFGLGPHTIVDSLFITWPDGNITRKTNIESNQMLTVQLSKTENRKSEVITPQKFISTESKIGLKYKHEENDFVDFRIDSLLPNMYSRNGPGV